MNQFGNEPMDVAQMIIHRLRLWRAQRAQTQHTTAIAFTLDDSKTGGTGGGRVDTQYAIGLCSHASGDAATEFRAARKYLTRVFSPAKRNRFNTRQSRLRGHDGHLFFVDIKIGEDVLNVVVLFERFNELEHLLRRRARQFDVVLGNPGNLR